MALHVALLEPLPPDATGAVAARCGAADASLHIVGPLPYAEDEPAMRAAGPADWDALDWWVHPNWRAFRDAMSRERCLYFAHDAERDPAEAPYRANSVLVVGNAEGLLPDAIRAKYGERIYKLPMPPRKRKVDLAASVELLLEVAADGVRRREERRTAAVEVKPTGPLRYGRR